MSFIFDIIEEVAGEVLEYGVGKTIRSMSNGRNKQDKDKKSFYKNAFESSDEGVVRQPFIEQQNERNEESLRREESKINNLSKRGNNLSNITQGEEGIMGGMTLREAMIAKEIFDKPLCKRGRTRGFRGGR